MKKSILDEIEKERDYQDSKWGGEVFDVDNSIHDWIVFIVQYASRNAGGYTGRTVSLEQLHKIRTDFLKVAALGAAATEYVDKILEQGATQS